MKLFYGAENCDVVAVHKLYKEINTPLELFDALSMVWCVETCTPRLRDKWSSENNTCGQCAITAFIFQDVFGGEIREMFFEDGSIHCYNVVNGKVFDLTNRQFKEKARTLDYSSNPLQDREMRLTNEEKKQRYELLKRRLKNYCEEHR